MKNKKLITLFIVTILLVGLSKGIVFANSLYSNGLRFTGEVTTTKKYYDGDALLRDDIILNGYCVDENNNTIDIGTKNIFIPNTADINNHAYIIHSNGKSCSGNINIDVKSFDPTVNYDEFNIDPIVFNKDNSLNSIRQSAEAYLWNKLEEANFYNNIGNKLDVNYEKVTVDTDVILLEDGIYAVPYEANFYTKNFKKENVYDSIKGTFQVVIGTSDIIESAVPMSRTALFQEPVITTPSLTATNLVLGLNTTFDINLNNKIFGSKYTWYSSNPKVAKVNVDNGVITPVSNGKAIITCEVLLPDGNKLTPECKVIVGYDEDTPVLSEDNLELEVGDVFRVKISNLSVDSEVSWKSSDKTIAKVISKTGKITAIANGETYVICTITVPETNQIIIIRCDVFISE